MTLKMGVDMMLEHLTICFSQAAEVGRPQRFPSNVYVHRALRLASIPRARAPRPPPTRPQTSVSPGGGGGGGGISALPEGVEHAAEGVAGSATARARE